ncbi:hypothetical protein KAX75_00430 [candidate division WOR-3 bacterium]|nr:hypothetical protein [candidate division WOR-3 bacterium]
MKNSLVQKGSVMIVFIIILFSSILTGEEYEIQVPVIENPKIKIDGYLNEECWKKAASVSEFIQIEPEEGEKPSCETDVLTWTDRTNLYIGFICYDNEPSKLRFSRTERDRFTQGDRIEVQVATDNPPTRRANGVRLKTENRLITTVVFSCISFHLSQIIKVYLPKLYPPKF